MKKDLIVAKIKSYFEILYKKQFYNIKDGLKLQGVIYQDDALSNKRELVLQKGVLWSKKACTYHVKTQIKFDRHAHRDLFLYLDLGKSSALEAISFLYGPEGLVSIDGEHVFGMDPYHKLNRVPEKFIDGEIHELSIDGWTGIKEEQYQVNELMICQRHEYIYELLLHTKAVMDLVDSDLYDDYTFRQVLNNYMTMVNQLDFDMDGNGLDSIVKEKLDKYKNGLRQFSRSDTLSIYACGHGHLDIAWLWDIHQSKKKAAQTFNNVLAIQDKDPSLIFSQTQMQLYAYVQENYPHTFNRIQDSIRAGRWEVLGMSWVEFDCNLTGAESLVRQFLLGQHYSHDQLDGHCSPVAWLPDTFGFCGQLPQILKGVGIDYFATAKLTWNGYNKFPYESFNWIGIDGTRILSHLVSTSKPGWWGATYSADMTVQEVAETKNQIQQKEKVQELLVPFGRGDGGGGPTEEMSRFIDIMNEYNCLPKVNKSRFIDFFDQLDQRDEALSTWNGELYFELHRGTYTSQAKTKKGNRQCEIMMHIAEFLATWTNTLNVAAYPFETFDKLWKTICLNQFHDILPGSSIGKVYSRVEREYEAIMEELTEIIDDYVGKLASVAPDTMAYMVLNASPVTQSAILELPQALPDHVSLMDQEGQLYPTVNVKDKTLAYVGHVSAYTMLYLSEVETKNNPIDGLGEIESRHETIGKKLGYICGEHYILENSNIKVTMNANGELISVWDKEVNREVISQGALANRWNLYEDIPADWEAWDIEEYYQDKITANLIVSCINFIENSPLRAVIRLTGTIGVSSIEQDIILEHHHKNIRFRTIVDWRESKKLLRVDFPVDIHNTHATYDVQWGSVSRPVTRNTTWEQAQFETSAHKWVDFSEGNYGVGLVNDCKYGYSVKDNVMSLTALKAAKFPDPTADLGTHEFTYSLFPHVGNGIKDTMRIGYALNMPMAIHKVKGLSKTDAKSHSFIQPGENLIIETIKKSEDQEGYVLRGYEWNNTRGTERIQGLQNVRKASKCNLLEAEQENLSVINNEIEVTYKPYEIVTIKVT